MNIHLASSRGFCSGVRRAVEIVEKTLASTDEPVYILHEIVHNRLVVEHFRVSGAISVESLSAVPDGALVIFSAHGVADSDEDEARTRSLRVIDATCPLVKHVQNLAVSLSSSGYSVILFGRAGHRETEGILARIKGPKSLIENMTDALAFSPLRGVKYTCLSQTTMNGSELERLVEVLKGKIPDLLVNANVCPATDERQKAVRRLALKCAAVFVAGSWNSSNTRRLCETAESAGAKAYLVDDPSSITPSMIENMSDVGVAAGASAPESLVEAIILKLQSLGGAFKGEI